MESTEPAIKTMMNKASSPMYTGLEIGGRSSSRCWGETWSHTSRSAASTESTAGYLQIWIFDRGTGRADALVDAALFAEIYAGERSGVHVERGRQGRAAFYNRK